MVLLECEFKCVGPGQHFCIGNPDYSNGAYPYCGPALMDCTRLERPLPDGSNAVDEKGHLHTLAEDEVVIKYR